MAHQSENKPVDGEDETVLRCVIDRDGKISYISPQLAQMSNMTAEDIIGQNVQNFVFHREARLDRRAKQLEEAEEIAKMGHWRWSVGDNEITWSNQIYKIFGVTPENFTPTLENINSRMLKRDLGMLYRAFENAIAERRDYEIDFRFRHPSGQVRFIRCQGRCVIDPETSEVTALYGIMQDMTERTLHERALKEAKEAAEQAYAAKTRFLANMSHELRTPLNAIIGFSEMMQRQLLGPIGNERYLEYISGIRESGEHLLDLINDILDMSKIEAGKYELNLETINISKLIRLSVHMMEGRAHESDIRLIVPENLPDDLQIVADRRGVTQILLNIISNAIKFTEPEGSVTITCNETPDQVSICVTDTGIGIPPSKIKHITRPFEQVDSALTRKREGSGLGLTITKELVQLHKGTLNIQSFPGKGTTVTVTLPTQPEKINTQPNTKNVA